MNYNNYPPPAGAPPPQGHPPEGYPKDAYTPQGYPPQQLYTFQYCSSSPYGGPPPPHDSSGEGRGVGCIEGCLAALCCCCLVDACF